MFIDKTHLVQRIRDICGTILCMTKRFGIRIEKLGDLSIGSFPKTAAPVIQRVFGLENSDEFGRH
jgi:hypothetical protein